MEALCTSIHQVPGKDSSQGFAENIYPYQILPINPDLGGQPGA